MIGILGVVYAVHESDEPQSLGLVRELTHAAQPDLAEPLDESDVARRVHLGQVADQVVEPVVRRGAPLTGRGRCGLIGAPSSSTTA